MLLVITSTGDRFFRFINTDDLERPWTSKIFGLDSGFYPPKLESKSSASSPPLSGFLLRV